MPSLEAFFYAHNGRRPNVISARLDAIKAAIPLTEDAGVIVPCRLHVLVLVEQLRTTLPAIDRFDREIAELRRRCRITAYFKTCRVRAFI